MIESKRSPGGAQLGTIVIAREFNRFLVAFGLDLRKTVQAVRGLPSFVRSLHKYHQFRDPVFPLHYSNLYPCLSDQFATAAEVSFGHYFHQDLWASRKVYNARPKQHIDIGSRVDGFVTHILTFMSITLIDIRPFEGAPEGLTFLQADATSLDMLADSSVESLSSLNVVEHFGLGRYGDPIDPSAPFKAMQSMARVIRPGGRLYFAVPVGRQRLEFNGHRVFSPVRILDHLHPLRLVSFAAVDDKGRFREGVNPEDYADAHFACGLYEFTR
jgi:hypothetical protein